MGKPNLSEKLEDAITKGKLAQKAHQEMVTGCMDVLLTESAAYVSKVRCSDCHEEINVNNGYYSRFYEDGTFSATCSHCHKPD